MFHGHWLVADVDGTLLPTPTKGGGRYYSFSGAAAATFAGRPSSSGPYRSCLPALRRFIGHGGSLCVVSTAGRRLWEQVYPDLAPALFPSQPREKKSPCSSSSSTPATEAGSPPPASGDRAAAHAEQPGQLLICGFTGAALFQTLPHRRAVSPPPPSAAEGLREWAAYREEGRTTISSAVQAEVVAEGRAAVIRFFEHASAVSRHDLGAAAAFFAGCLSAKYHATYTEMLAEMLAECAEEVAAARAGPHGVRPVCFAHTQAMAVSRLTTHGFFLKETKDAIVDAQRVPLADGSVPDDAPVAQVVVMGIPMRLYDTIFPRTEGDGAAQQLQCCPRCRLGAISHPDTGRPAGVARMEEGLGLAVKRQPNSVCIHQRGVDKATCVRWLTARGGELAFALDRALSLGDVPATVDRPLAEFPPMRMISLSPLQNDGCATAEERARLVAGGMVHVGGEEEGTALFLDALLDDCEESYRKSQGSSNSGMSPMPATWFDEERVLRCAARAREAMSQL